MRIIPWRVKAFLSNHFPLAYHLAVNVGWRGNSEQHWDRTLESTWSDPARTWPTKVEVIASLTHPDMKILDVACGTGSILRALKERGCTGLHALEISAYAVSRLNAEGIHARRGMLPRISFPDDEFDVVIASQVLEHIVRRGAFAKEIRRVLKPSGRVFIFVPNNCLGPIDEPEHVMVYQAASLKRFLERYFTVTALDSMHDANHQIPILFAQAQKDGP
jgi:ubiquinone/menaquinone biosynthesis C-methylase UbiE